MPDCKAGAIWVSLNAFKLQHSKGARATYKEENHAESEAEEDGTGKVGVVHDTLVGLRERVENGEGFGEDVGRVDAELCHHESAKRPSTSRAVRSERLLRRETRPGQAHAV